MTYKKYKYKKTIKKRKKKRGGQLPGIPATLQKNPTSSLPSNPLGGIPKPGQMVGSAQSKTLGGLNAPLAHVKSTLKSANDIKNEGVKKTKKAFHSVYRYFAEFIFKLNTSKNLNFTFIKKLFAAPKLRVHKYKENIDLLNDNDKLNYIAACKLLYIYYYTEYVEESNLIFDKAKNINETCFMFNKIDNQMRLFNSSKKKLLEHFDMVFRNNKFKELYTKSLPTIIEHLKERPDDNVVEPAKGVYCKQMRNEIENLFIVDGNNYSYIILYILYDLYKYDTIKINNEKSVEVLTKMFDELKNNINEGGPIKEEIIKTKEEAKISKIKNEEKDILSQCDEKNYIDIQRNIINMIP